MQAIVPWVPERLSASSSSRFCLWVVISSAVAMVTVWLVS